MTRRAAGEPEAIAGCRIAWIALGMEYYILSTSVRLETGFKPAPSRCFSEINAASDRHGGHLSPVQARECLESKPATVQLSGILCLCTTQYCRSTVGPQAILTPHSPHTWLLTPELPPPLRPADVSESDGPWGRLADTVGVTATERLDRQA